MAQKPNKSDNSSRNLLVVGLLFVLLSIAGFAYELLRPPTEDEKKAMREQAKIQAEIDKKNAPRAAP